MSFGDTVTVTINAVPKILNRISDDGYTSEYFLRESASEFRMRIRHSTRVDSARGVRVDRHNVELTETVYPVAPAVVTTERKAYVIMENDYDDGAVDPLDFDLGFVGFITSANITKLINWES